MTSKRRWSLVVAAIVASLTFGGLVTLTTPAGAALATNWGKIWKTKLQPKADKRYYKKTQANKKFAPKPGLIRGTYFAGGTSPSGSILLSGGSISFGVAFSAAPTPHYISIGDPVPVGCSGTAEAPNADPGHLCMFETRAENVTSNKGPLRPDGGVGTTPFGAGVFAYTVAAGQGAILGTWAARPLKPVYGPTLPKPGPASSPSGGLTR